MTAIGGIIRFDQARPDPAALKRLEGALTPFGRDSQTSVISGQAGLVRTLLRSTAEDFLDHQPLAHDASGVQLVFDGRIDNREALADKLGLRKAELSQMSDSALVLAGVLRWDATVCAHLLGDFALAVWRSRDRRLWLARDPLGIRPLFWHITGEHVVFSSQATALFATGGIEKVLDQETLHDTLALIPNRSDRSFFRGIQRVRPGHVVSVSDRGQVRQHRYHDFTPKRKIRYARDEEYVEAFSQHVTDAVACRLRTHGTVASHLSSGLDSTAVTTVAASLLSAESKSLYAITAGPRAGFAGPCPRGHHIDEISHARSVAQRYANIEHAVYRHEADSHLEGLTAAIDTLGRPPLNLDNLGWARGVQTALSQQGAQVVLTGWFGNFGASYTGGERLPNLFITGRWLALLREILAFRSIAPRRYRGWALGAVLGPFLPAKVWTTVARRLGHEPGGLRSYSALSPQQIAQMGTVERAKRVKHDLNFQGSPSSLRSRVQGLELVDPGEYALMDDVLGLQSRHPLGDWRVLDYALSIPDDQFLKNAEHSRLMKRFLKDKVPAPFLAIKTKGLQAADWHETLDQGRAALYHEIGRLRKNDAVTHMVDVDALEAAVTSPAGDPTDADYVKSHRFKLLRGLSVGRFIAHHTDGNG